MKKLMVTTAALALAGSVLAGAITSANIVGYTIKKRASDGNYMTITPCFSAVGSDEGYSIQNIKPVSGFEGYGTENIQAMTAGGNVSTSYFYYSEEGAELSGMSEGEGWYDGSSLSTLKIKSGEAFLLDAPADSEIQCAGQVNFVGGTASIASTAEGSYIWLGNAAPVEMDIQKFTPVSGFDGFGTEDIQVLSSAGNVVETYYYYVEDSGLAPDGDGWYLEGADTLATRKFAPGEGFILEVSGPSEINVPAATKPTAE